MTAIRKQGSRKGTAIYEQVLQKNFEIIETFLKKFHQIFIRQDQFEEHLNKFEVRFNEYDEGLEEFRKQHQLSLVMLQKKVNNMKVSTRESIRSSHRQSKAKIPVFEAVQTPQGGKNFTLMRFDTLEQPVVKQQISQPQVQRKQTSESETFSMKNYDSIKETIDSMKQDMIQMKDKVKFLSIYASSIDGQQATKNKMDVMKKQILHTLEDQFNKKLQKELRTQMIETQNVFIQQIKNLTTKISQQLVHQIQEKSEIFQFQLEKINQKFCTKKQAQELQQKTSKNLKQFAEQSMKIFAQKEELRKYLNHMEKKFKLFEGQVKNQIQRSQKDKKQAQYFTSLLQVSTPNGKSSKTLQKSSKSQTQWAKKISRSLSFSMNQQGDVKEKEKQTLINKSSLSQSVQNLSKGSLFTSQVSKQFMKNFGVKQKKLIKGSFMTSKKSSFHINQVDSENKANIRQKSSPQDNLLFQQQNQSP